MLYRRLGRSGLQISELSLGSWVTFGRQVQLDSAKTMIKAAFDGGINFFDNAEAYENGQSEILMGEAIAALGLPRDEYIVSSKVFWGGPKPTQKGLSAKHINDACNAALQRLQVDYLDLYYCHRPDKDTPIEETVRAMHNLITRGKVMYWGTSEWSAQEITQAHAVARQYNMTPPQMEQAEYNLFNRKRVDDEYRRLYGELGMGITTFSPLAAGVLTGRYNDSLENAGRLNLPGYEWLKAIYESEEGKQRLEKSRRLAALAASIGIPLHHLALLWCLNNPNVSSIILGASRLEQVKDNLTVLDNRHKLNQNVAHQIEEIMANRPVDPVDWKAI
jgi:voltage-dependent potassium channel beta subunit